MFIFIEISRLVEIILDTLSQLRTDYVLVLDGAVSSLLRKP
jgi:hypothetical protein